MQTSIVFKSHSRRSLDISKRDNYALNALDRTMMKVICNNIRLLCGVVKALKNNKLLRAIIKKHLVEQYGMLLKIIIVDNSIKGHRIRVVYDLMILKVHQFILVAEYNL